LRKRFAIFQLSKANIETDFDFWRDRLAIRRKTLGELILRGMADEESRPQGLKDRGFPTLVGLDDDVEPLAQPFDRQGLAELAEIVEADPPQLETHAWRPR
jgi:hypothetical protein